MGGFNPTLKETEHLVSRLIVSKKKSGELSDEQVSFVKNRTWDIAEKMSEINDIDDELIFEELALAVIYKMTAEY